jgi:glycosyltransferase involved in cell wall biosynthesis
MIEILMATYNGKKYIEEQLESIIRQEGTEIILTVRDDGSTDGTARIVNEYAEKYPQLIRLISDGEATGSAKANFLRLIYQAAGDYVMFADQDDVWDRDKVEKTLDYMMRLEKKYGKDTPLLVHTDLRVVDENLNEIAPSFFDLMRLPKKKGLNDLLIQNSVVGCTVMINRKLLNMAKQALTTEHVLMHDHFLALVAAAYGHLGYADITPVAYRQHTGNQVGTGEYTHKLSVLRRLKKGREGFREDMESSYRQVQYMVELYGTAFTKSSYKEIICGYAGLLSATTAEKRRFYRKYNIYKNSPLKKLMQILWT